jgi:5-methyltetrahydrofolate--homocysteine methyltransferase
LNGRFPAILDDAKFGEAARSLFSDTQAMLQRIVAEGWFKASAVLGLWPANSEGDDILIFADEARSRPIAVLHTLRQQLPRREGRANVALADFVAPRASGLADYIGAFAVTAGTGEQAVVERFKHANDDYSGIMAKALADRLAEALAESLHARVRREFWRYAPDETLSAGDLIAEKYRGIRPAPGYPAQPDHTEKATLFNLLDGERRIGVRLTESFAMWPGASVCGLYFSHPDSYYFGVGKIERDQVEDYARRKGWMPEQAERWLAPILNYDALAAVRRAAE